MADVSLIHHDCMDDSDEGFEQGDCPVPFSTPEDDVSLPPLVRLQKYAQSVNIIHRQMVVRMVQDFFRTVPADLLTQDLPEIMKIVTKIGDESRLRADLLEQIPHIAAQAVESSSRVSALKNVVGEYLIPLVVRNLGYSDNAVDKAAHATLIHLVEQGFISKQQAEIQVCPSILALSKVTTVADVQTGAIKLMSKLAPLLGRDVTERVFLKRFTELCTSPLLFVRKVCASRFGEFCSVIGKDAFENTLLPSYIALCSDEVWGVRKACAEVAIFISCACPPNIRKDLVAPVFAKMLQDDCRWVRMVAFQALGPFIATFADPPVTSIGYSKSGDLVLLNSEGGEFRMSSTESLNMTERLSMYVDELKGEDYFGYLELKDDVEGNSSVINENQCDNLAEKIDDDLGKGLANLSIDVFSDDYHLNTSSSNCEPSENTAKNFIEDQEKTQSNNAQLQVISDLDNTQCNNTSNDNKEPKVNVSDNENSIEDEDLHLFNSYNYWYISPELPIDLNIISGSEPKPVSAGYGDVAALLQKIYAKVSLSESLQENDTANNSTISVPDENDLGEVDEVASVEESEPPQNVVPQYLIDHYISMTDPNLVLNIDNEMMTYHCAYSLPAVVLTLGRENWHLLKKTIETLAGAMHYQVRRTVACSLHELAEILGTDIATNDLTPLFDGFIKDLDEVRIGILKHLAKFLTLIHPSKRNTYMARLPDFLVTDNQWNWRFRQELANQLYEVVPLFNCYESGKYMAFIAFELLCDQIAAIREAALLLITKIVCYTNEKPMLKSKLLLKLADDFAHSKKWKKRQTFCLLCIELLKEKAVSCEQFASDLMPHLLDLSWDPVANVRLVVAKCLSCHIINNEYFNDPENENCDGLETVLKRLQADKDRDVRQSAEL